MWLLYVYILENISVGVVSLVEECNIFINQWREGVGFPEGFPEGKLEGYPDNFPKGNPDIG